MGLHLGLRKTLELGWGWLQGWVLGQSTAKKGFQWEPEVRLEGKVWSFIPSGAFRSPPPPVPLAPPPVSPPPLHL